MTIRSITTWNMPSGEQITADDDDMTGIVSYYKHNPHVAIEERDFFLQVQECRELLRKQEMGRRLTPDELDLIQETREILGEVEPPKPEPKKRRKTKAEKQAEQQLAEASDQDLISRGIK